MKWAFKIYIVSPWLLQKNVIKKISNYCCSSCYGLIVQHRCFSIITFQGQKSVPVILLVRSWQWGTITVNNGQKTDKGLKLYTNSLTYQANRQERLLIRHFTNLSREERRKGCWAFRLELNSISRKLNAQLIWYQKVVAAEQVGRPLSTHLNFYA